MEWRIQETYKIEFLKKEEIHRKVDIAINRMEKEIGEIKLKHRGILVKHLDEIKQLHSPMFLILLALNKMMVSNEVSAVINYSCENEIKRLDIKV